MYFLREHYKILKKKIEKIIVFGEKRITKNKRKKQFEKKLEKNNKRNLKIFKKQSSRKEKLKEILKKKIFQKKIENIFILFIKFP